MVRKYFTLLGLLFVLSGCLVAQEPTLCFPDCGLPGGISYNPSGAMPPSFLENQGLTSSSLPDTLGAETGGSTAGSWDPSFASELSPPMATPSGMLSSRSIGALTVSALSGPAQGMIRSYGFLDRSINLANLMLGLASMGEASALEMGGFEAAQAAADDAVVARGDFFLQKPPIQSAVKSEAPSLFDSSVFRTKVSPEVEFRGAWNTTGKKAVTYYQEGDFGFWRTSNHWGKLTDVTRILGDGTPEYYKSLGGVEGEPGFWVFPEPITGWVSRPW